MQPKTVDIFNCDLWHKIPPHCREGLKRYVERGVPVGHFLTALLSNDLKETYSRADETNARHIRDYIMWLYNEAPAGCWGSPKRFKDWIARGGLVGLNDEVHAEEGPDTDET